MSSLTRASTAHTKSSDVYEDYGQNSGPEVIKLFYAQLK